jgi:hypothetical protein
MFAKAKNPLIFLAIIVLVTLFYFIFLKKSPGEEPLLTSSPSASLPAGAPASGAGSFLAEDFLSLLLGVKNIRLDDSIFSDPAFFSLRDSSIELVQDGSEGRPNPFAPLGVDIPI